MQKPALIDCDVHHSWRSDSDVLEYLPRRWRESIPSIHPPMMWIQQSFGTNARLDAFGSDGSAPGTDYVTMKEQYLDPFNVRKAKLSFNIGQQGGLKNPYAATQVVRAINEWNKDHWLSINDDRLVSVVLVAMQDPEAAAMEIRRVAGHPKIVEVLLVPNPLGKPFGHPIYHPIYEAAAEVGLPVGVHIGGEGFAKSTMHIAGGSANCKMDYLTLQPQPMMHHMASFITHGVFEKFPTLKALFIESGVAWLPAFAWKMDSMFDVWRQESDWVKKMPSDYVREHVRLSTQPMEMSPERGMFLDLMEAYDGMEHILCFASDYPHWDTDSPTSIQTRLPRRWHADVFYRNGARLYGFDDLSDDQIFGNLAPEATAP
jgi:uncharacterized protein